MIISAIIIAVLFPICWHVAAWLARIFFLQLIIKGLEEKATELINKIKGGVKVGKNDG